MRRSTAILVLVLTMVMSSIVVAGHRPLSPRDANYVPDRLIVKFRPGTPGESVRSLNAGIGATTLRQLRGHGNVRLIEIPRGWDVPRAQAFYKRNPNVLYADPDFLIHLLDAPLPDDPLFVDQWALHNTGQQGGLFGFDIDAPEAWDKAAAQEGSLPLAPLLIAVIDSGMYLTHPDLRDRRWTNFAEQNGLPGVDDDGNGYIDDIYGYDWFHDDGTPEGESRHGSHVSGILGATRNNAKGISGIANGRPTSGETGPRIMSLKIFGAFGIGSTSDAVEAIDYAIDKGAVIQNHSWGCNGPCDPAELNALIEAIDRADQAGVLLVFAAGNFGTDTDVNPQYPASLPNPNIISVTSVNRHGEQSDSTAWGTTTVDLGAPGERILSTVLFSLYNVLSGTSMSAPHVTGSIMFLMRSFPGLTHSEYKQLILDSVVEHQDMMPGGSRPNVSGGVLNLDRAFNLADCDDPDSCCGNNVTESLEICDGTDLGGATCLSEGFDAGDLGCSGSCDDFDTGGCWVFGCGNGICEPGEGEDCLSCPADCNGKQTGKPNGRFCCGDGEGRGPVDCSDPRCTESGYECYE